jgi:hypothetical protein
VCGCEGSLLCVCVCRCVQLKQLSIRYCCKVTDVGVSRVVHNCYQLHTLELYMLQHITGLCAVCEDPEPTLCFITMLYDILTTDSSHITKAHHWTIL